VSSLTVIFVASGAPTTVERSLESLVQQTGLEIELVYIDNSPTPETNERIEEILKLYDAQRVSKPGAPRAQAWNEALAASKGDYISMLDAGHILAEGAYATLAGILDSDTDLAGAYGRTAVIDGEANVRYQPERGKTGRIFNRVASNKHFFSASSCVLWRRRVLEPPFNEVYKTPKAIFLEHALRITIDQPLAFADQTIVTAPAMKDDYLVIEELVKVFLVALYGMDFDSERSETKLRKRLARQLVAIGKIHYRREEYVQASRYISEAVRIAPTYFKGRRYQFLNFVKDLVSRPDPAKPA